MTIIKIILVVPLILLSGCNDRDLEEKKAMLRSEADLRIKRVIRQLKADCLANLPEETYKRVKQLQKSTRPRIVKKKG